MASSIGFGRYAALSVSGFAACVFHGVYTREDLHEVFEFLTTEKIAMVACYNMLVMLYLSMCRVTLYLCFGVLRAQEIQQVFDAGRAFLMDTILFLVLSSPTFNGEEIHSTALAQYLSIIVTFKLFHLVTQIRVVHLANVGHVSFFQLARLCVVLFLLWLCDAALLINFWRKSGGESTFFLWTLFEVFGMLLCVSVSIIKYGIYLVDVRLSHTWTGKTALLFYIDLVNVILSLSIFLLFMLTFFFNNPAKLPLYMVADIIQVLRALIERVGSLRRYRKLTQDMEKTFIDASEAELANADSCIICRDSLGPGAKILSCSHVFHLACLKSWLVHQQSCPTCRAPIQVQETRRTPRVDGPSPPPSSPPQAKSLGKKFSEIMGRTSAGRIAAGRAEQAILWGPPKPSEPESETSRIPPEPLATGRVTAQDVWRAHYLCELSRQRALMAIEHKRLLERERKVRQEEEKLRNSEK